MIGGDVPIEKYKFRARPQRMDFVLFPPDQKGKEISMFSVIMLLCTVCMGTGPFLMYENFFKCGIIEVLLIILFVMILVQLSIHVYTRCWFYGVAYDYQQICKFVFGSKWLSFIPLILNILAYLTFACRFGLEISKNGFAFLNQIWPKCPGFLKSKYFLLYFVNLLTTFPSLFARNIISLSWIAYIGIIAKLVVILCLIIMLINCIKEMGFKVVVKTFASVDNALPFIPFISLFSKDPAVFFNCVSTIMIAFFMHPMLNTIFAQMRNPTVFRCMKSTWLASVLFIIIFYGIGVVAYFVVQTHMQDAYETEQIFNETHNFSVYFDRPFNLFYIANKFKIKKFTNRNVFFNYKTDRVEAIVGQISCYVVTVTSNIIYTHFIATQVSSIIIDPKETSQISIVISGVAVNLFAIGVNFMDGRIIDVLDAISSFALIILEFILPSFCYLQLYRFTRPFWGVISLIVLILGIPTGLTCVYYKILYLKSLF